MKQKQQTYNHSSVYRLRSSITSLCSIVLILCSIISSHAQLKTAIDSTSIKIGEELLLQLEVETDTTDLVIFPEGQTFSPLEMIHSYKIDTTKKDARYKLIKKYGLTQFDSGRYTIPMQKVVIGNKTLFSDSLKIEVRDIVIDTTKQGLFGIKPIIDVDKPSSQWWKWLLYILPILALIAGLLYWYIWRKKPLTEEEKERLLPPYERAQLALQKLDESKYLINSELKNYYSELTGIIRTYLDEKVYDHSLESTTDELVERLNLLKDGNQIDLSKDTIKNIETILKRADLVKFAKNKPNPELAKLDRKTIASEIDHVKAVLPEPTEDEKLQDEAYLEELARKQKRKKTILTIAISVFLLIGTFVGFSVKYGFNYVKDTIIGHESKELLEGQWVTSDYGAPPVTISTPKVLKRVEVPEAQQSPAKVTTFSYGSLLDFFSVTVVNTQLPPQQGQQPQQGGSPQQQAQPKVDFEAISEATIQTLEQQGVSNIFVKRDKFTTPNGAEGLKTYGTANYPITKGSDTTVEGNYIQLLFNAGNVVQQVIITSRQDDDYAEQMVTRILNSIELQKPQSQTPQNPK